MLSIYFDKKGRKVLLYIYQQLIKKEGEYVK